MSVGVEIDLINAGLLWRAWLAVPCFGAQLDFAESFHDETTPAAHSS